MGKKARGHRKRQTGKDEERDKVFCDVTGPNVKGHALVS